MRVSHLKKLICVTKGTKDIGKLKAEGSKLKVEGEDELKAEGPDELKAESSKFEIDKVWRRA